MSHGVVVVGAGQAALSLIEKLRILDADRPITLVGAEPHLPYQRPPLSKRYLLGEMGVDELPLRPRSWFDERRVALRLGVAAAALDVEARRLTLADGSTLPYDDLALCTGSHPRRLPDSLGGALRGVHVLRGVADVDALRPDMAPGRKLLIVGGGYVGLEAAAVAAKSGLAVTLIEAAPRILQRVAAEPTADYFRNLHREHGVDIREGASLVRLLGTERVTAAALATGEEIPVDTALIGIGAEASVDLAATAGLDVANGVVVDEHSRTSAPHVVAAGDCANFPYKGRRIRLESVQNAIEQGANAAATLAGVPEPYRPTPWFWSDQYEAKLQIAGLSAGSDDVIVRRGRRPGSQSVWCFQGATLLSVDAMNDGASFVAARKLLEAGINPDKAAVADPQVAIASLLPGRG